jgi:hypothetical protein
MRPTATGLFSWIHHDVHASGIKAMVIDQSRRRKGFMSSKRQTTMAKLNRERRVKEKRELKREKKLAAAAAKLAESESSPETADAATADESEAAGEARDE